MGWIRELPQAIESELPIILKLDFDPGWKDLRAKFEGKASDVKPPRHVQTLLNNEHHMFAFKSTAEFIRMSETIKETDPEAFSRTYIMYENDMRSFDEFVVGRNKRKFIDMQNAFYSEVTAISKLKSGEKRQFLSGIEGAHDKRAASFPVLTYFSPSKATAEGKKGRGLLIDKGLLEAFKEKSEAGDFVALQGLDARRSPKARQYLMNNETVAVIGVPYIHRDQVERNIEDHRDFEDPNTKYALIQMKIQTTNQVCTRIPSALDHG